MLHHLRLKTKSIGARNHFQIKKWINQLLHVVKCKPRVRNGVPSFLIVSDWVSPRPKSGHRVEIWGKRKNIGWLDSKSWFGLLLDAFKWYLESASLMSHGLCWVITRYALTNLPIIRSSFDRRLSLAGKRFTPGSWDLSRWSTQLGEKENRKTNLLHIDILGSRYGIADRLIQSVLESVPGVRFVGLRVDAGWMFWSSRPARNAI